jgi:hypothetical protein
MRRLLFVLTLAVYGFSAMDLHEWVRVPQVVLHLLEHHSDLGHHDEEGSQHGDHGDHDHSPFDEDCHGEFCACSGLLALCSTEGSALISLLPLTTTLGAQELPMASGAFTGGVWNPPKSC